MLDKYFVLNEKKCYNDLLLPQCTLAEIVVEDMAEQIPRF